MTSRPWGGTKDFVTTVYKSFSAKKRDYEGGGVKSIINCVTSFMDDPLYISFDLVTFEAVVINESI